jgi:hypothetical protein
MYSEYEKKVISEISRKRVKKRWQSKEQREKQSELMKRLWQEGKLGVKK